MDLLWVYYGTRYFVLFGSEKYDFIYNRIRYWDTSTSPQVSHCDGVVLKIYLDRKFQWPQEGLNCESFSYEVGIVVN